MKIKNITVEPYLKTVKRQKAETQGLLHPAQANLRYFLVRFQSFQLPSTQSESPLALIPLAPKSCETKLNSVAVDRKRTIPTERPPLVGEVFN
jgi:hypothetical protein